jgi:hypothetical protein
VDPFVNNVAHISLSHISTIYSVPLFCYMKHKIGIRFRHWLSQALLVYKVCKYVPTYFGLYWHTSSNMFHSTLTHQLPHVFFPPWHTSSHMFLSSLTYQLPHVSFLTDTPDPTCFFSHWHTSSHMFRTHPSGVSKSLNLQQLLCHNITVNLTKCCKFVCSKCNNWITMYGMEIVQFKQTVTSNMKVSTSSLISSSVKLAPLSAASSNMSKNATRFFLTAINRQKNYST